MQAAAQATEVQRGLASAEDANVMAELDPAQNEVIQLTAGERARFAAVLAPLIDEQRQLFGDTLFGMIENRPD